MPFFSENGYEGDTMGGDVRSKRSTEFRGETLGDIDPFFAGNRATDVIDDAERDHGIESVRSVLRKPGCDAASRRRLKEITENYVDFQAARHIVPAGPRRGVRVGNCSGVDVDAVDMNSGTFGSRDVAVRKRIAEMSRQLVAAARDVE